MPQVVPESVRTSVYAFDKCIIGALGAATTPLAGLLAERAFGFQHVSQKKPMKGHAAIHAHVPASAIAAQHANNLNNARALENGLMCIMLVSSSFSFLCTAHICRARMLMGLAGKTGIQGCILAQDLGAAVNHIKNINILHRRPGCIIVSSAIPWRVPGFGPASEVCGVPADTNGSKILHLLWALLDAAP